MRVLLVDIDTLRPDHMGCYGYSRNTTPNIDTIAEQGVRFDNYYCPDAPCLPSRAAMVSGLFGIKNGVVGHGGTAADKRLSGRDRDFVNQDDENNLFNIFRKKGFYTASISTFAERHSAWWFNAGFNETYNVGGGGMESGEAVLPVALDWLQRKGKDDNWFLHLHLWDPHTPYRAPEDFGNPFEKEPFSDWIDEAVFQRQLKKTGPHSLLDLNMYDDKTNPKYPRMPGKVTEYKDLRRIFDGYDTGVRYTDSLVGKVFDRLRELGVFEDCAIIVTSDHGETLGEFGIYCEHGVADEATCRIPMIVKWPGCAAGQSDRHFHYNLDLAPTLAELFEIPPYKKWDGKSYAQNLLKGKGGGWDSLVLSQMAHVCQRSARFDDWLYMRTYHDGYHLFDREMLFNLKDDPHEQRDVKAKYPEICARGARIILDWHDEQMLGSEYATDPLWTVLREKGPYHTWDVLETYLKRLEVTGRGEGAAALRKKYGIALGKRRA
jgi:arylsulfatase A-like enzyme